MGARFCHGGPVVNTREFILIINKNKSDSLLSTIVQPRLLKEIKETRLIENFILLPNICFTSKYTTLNDFRCCPMSSTYNKK